MPRIALVTCRTLPDLTPDDRLLATELERRGLEATPAVWDDPAMDWERFDGLVLRSCWDYHLRPREFGVWLDHLDACGARVWNPTSLVRWNLHKEYLRELAGAAVPILPTVWLTRGSSVRLDEVLATRGWPRAVVKPAVSASAYGTWVVDARDSAASQSRFERLLSERDALVQLFEPALVEEGEWSLVFIGGRYSHAVLKKPRADDFRVQEEHGGSSTPGEPPPRLIEAGRRLLSRLPHPWLYARIDGIDVRGEFILMELELVEPVLYFASDPAAAGRMVDAIEAAAGAAVKPSS